MASGPGKNKISAQLPCQAAMGKGAPDILELTGGRPMAVGAAPDDKGEPGRLELAGGEPMDLASAAPGWLSASSGAERRAFANPTRFAPQS
mmetsp:Transcript_37097/g.102087  ORF Transcript_37097/g.102087 Transcript_37097/m.102087 type:complete len:91 (+) Transcript_37097:114-386(+)